MAGRLDRVALGLLQVVDEAAEALPDDAHDEGRLAVARLARLVQGPADPLEGVDLDLAGQAVEHLDVEAERPVEALGELVADVPQRLLGELLVAGLLLALARAPAERLGDLAQGEPQDDGERHQVPERPDAELVDGRRDERAFRPDPLVAGLTVLGALAVDAQERERPLVDPLVVLDLRGCLLGLRLVERPLVGLHDLGHQVGFGPHGRDGDAPLRGERLDERVRDLGPERLRDTVAGGRRRGLRRMPLRRPRRCLLVRLLLTHHVLLSCFRRGRKLPRPALCETGVLRRPKVLPWVLQSY